MVLESSNPDFLFDSIFSTRRINITIFTGLMRDGFMTDEDNVNGEIKKTGLCVECLKQNHQTTSGHLG